MSVRIINGDCREEMPARGPYDMILADPPYGDTSLQWDKHVDGWEAVALQSCKPTGSMWVFGSMRFFMLTADRFRDAGGVDEQKRRLPGWRLAQDIVWEKHNGSGFHADRFKRVHEHAVQFYREDAPWAEVWNEVQTTADAVRRTVKRKKGHPAHMGNIEHAPFASEDGGPRIMRSVIEMHSCHGRAIHPTEKPVGLLELLIRTSCPPGGLVGDFFAGSGACGEACAVTGRYYFGTEIDPEMASKASDRMRSSLFGAAA